MITFCTKIRHCYTKFNSEFNKSKLEIAYFINCAIIYIFAQKYLCKWEDTYFVRLNKYHRINEDTFEQRLHT